MSDWADEIEVASHLAREAGRRIMLLYEKGVAVSYKGDNDPVTEADKEANSIIIEGLALHFPHDGIIAEESPLPLKPLGNDRVWYVDPLDGTKEFIAHNGEFSIMIGMSLSGCSQLGVVYWPSHDQLFAGVTDREAWVEHHGKTFPLQAAQTKHPQTLTLVTSRSHRSPNLSKINQTLNIAAEHPMGSVGLKVGFITQGNADVYIEPGPFTKLWDACAPEAILRGAGGCFTDLHGNPIHYATNEWRNMHGLVGCTKDCHQRVIQALTGLCVSCDV